MLTFEYRYCLKCKIKFVVPSGGVILKPRPIVEKCPHCGSRWTVPLLWG